MITRTVLNWTKEKYEEIDVTEQGAGKYVKAFALGAIEGAIDGVVLAYPVLLAGCYYWKKKALDK